MAETLTFNVLGRGDASDIERLAAAIDNLTSDLRKLDRTKAEPRVDVDTAQAERKVGRFAETLQRNLTRAIESLPEIDPEADFSDAQREIADVRRELQTLNDLRIGVDIDAAEAESRMRELQDRLRRLSTESADIQVQADTTAAIAALGLVNREVDKVDGRTARVKVDVDRGLSDTIVQIAALGRALKALSVPAGLVAAAPQIAAIGGAALAASGAVGLLPGALAAGGAAAATLQVGLHGVGDALKELDDAEKFAEALKELAPAAREFALAVRDIAPAWRDVRLDTQQALFAGLGEEMRQLSSTYLPSMRVGLTGVATEFNGIARSVSDFATQARTVADVDTIFRNTTAALHEAAPAARNLVAAFVDIATVGSDMLPELSSGLTQVTERFRVFIAQARESGQLGEWIQQGIDTLQTLGSIAGNVGSILLSVFQAAEQSGADLLGRLDAMTEAAAEFLRTGEGRAALVAAFREISDVVETVQPGLRTLAQAAAEAVQAFAATDGLQQAGQAFSDIAAAVAPLIPRLAELAGGTLGVLASAASNVAGALSPLISLLAGLLGALGPIGPAVTGMVIAFRALQGVGGAIGSLGTSLANIATKAGASETATSRLATAFSRLGGVVPIAGAAVVAITAVYEQLRSKAEESAKAVAEGSMTFQQAVDEELKRLQARQQAYEGLQGEGYAAGEAIGELTGKIDANAQKVAQEEQAVRLAEDAWRAHLDTLGPVERAKAELARAEGEYQDALRQFGPASQAATDAAGRLADANQNLQSAQQQAADAAKTHEQRLAELSDTMSSQIGTALAYEQAVRRTGDALKAANDALSEHGAGSDQYRESVLRAAQAVEQQAQAARRATEATHGAEAGVKAYNDELLKIDRSSQAGRDTFIKLASALDTAGLNALSAQAHMSGLKTEIITLPDGRRVEVVVNAEREQLDSVKTDLNAVEAKKYVGTVQIIGDPTPFQGSLLQTVQLADGTKATLKLDADGTPASVVIQGVKYQIDSTTGTLKILGDPAPGQASLDGFRLVVDSATGTMRLEANPAGADATLNAAVTAANGSVGTMTLEANPQPANGKITATVTFANGQTGTVTIDGNQQPANGKITATVRFADGSTGTVKIDANDAAARAAISALQKPTSSTHTIQIKYAGQRPASSTGIPIPQSGGGVIGYAGGGIAGRPVRASRGAVLPGYQPGVDTVPAVLSRGEAVLVPELTRAIGARRIMAANRAASGGRRATVVGRIASLMDGTIDRRRFAGGGLTLRPQISPIFPGATSGGDVSRLAAEIRSLLTLVQQRLGPAQITVEDRSGDPVQTGRAVQMALRMAR